MRRFVTSLFLSVHLFAGAPSFDAWFAKNTLVTNKKTYVHVFWNAQEARTSLQGEAKRSLIARAARRLVVTQFPKKATTDRVKLDVVFVRDRDSYGMPRWETLEKVAHLEFSRAKLLAGLAEGAVPSELEIGALFDVFEVK